MTDPAAPPADIEVLHDSDVDVIRIERPEVHNALRHESYAQLEQAVLRSAARCIVVTGTDPSFCAGDDVRAVMLARQGEAPAPRSPALTPASDALLHTDIPIIAAVNGAAVGWGAELALSADLRVASERARFGQLFVRRGLISTPASLARLAQLVGREKATELLLLGDVIDAEEALRIGMVGRVVPHDRLMVEAMSLAHRIAANPPLAVQGIKAGLRRALDPDWASLGRWVTAALDELSRTDDHVEAVRAFLDKRPATFIGH